MEQSVWACGSLSPGQELVLGAPRLGALSLFLISRGWGPPGGGGDRRPCQGRMGATLRHLRRRGWSLPPTPSGFGGRRSVQRLAFLGAPAAARGRTAVGSRPAPRRRRRLAAEASGADTPCSVPDAASHSASSRVARCRPRTQLFLSIRGGGRSPGGDASVDVRITNHPESGTKSKTSFVPRCGGNGLSLRI